MQLNLLLHDTLPGIGLCRPISHRHNISHYAFIGVYPIPNMKSIYHIVAESLIVAMVLNEILKCNHFFDWKYSLSKKPDKIMKVHFLFAECALFADN